MQGTEGRHDNGTREEARKQWKGVINILCKNNFQPRILYPVRVSIECEGRRKSLSDKKDLEIFASHGFICKKIWHDVLHQRGKKTRKRRALTQDINNPTKKTATKISRTEPNYLIGVRVRKTALRETLQI